MNFKLLKALMAISIFSTTLPAMANLITNGSFEDNIVGNGSWAWFSASDVNGWGGSNIEIWHNYSNFSAAKGSQLAELNAHPSSGSAFSIFQTFNTTANTLYDLSFFYSARSNNNEAFQLSLHASDNTEIFSQLIDDHEVRNWSYFSNSFSAISKTTTLRFTSVYPESGTVGNFLDDIKVFASANNIAQPVTDVPEPSALFLAGFGLLIVIRKKIKTKLIQSN